MKKPSIATIQRWNKACQAGVASKATEQKLITYVRNLVESTGFTPVALMGGYYAIAHKYEWKKGE